MKMNILSISWNKTKWKLTDAIAKPIRIYIMIKTKKNDKKESKLNVMCGAQNNVKPFFSLAVKLWPENPRLNYQSIDK